MHKYLGPLGGLALALVISGVALAEGQWTSELVGVNRNFNSRTWRDADLDDATTRVRFDECRDDVANGANDWATVRLWRHAGIFPPYKVGTDKTLACYVTDTKSWGEMTGAEDFHWQVLDFSGGGGSNRLDVDWLRTYY